MYDYYEPPYYEPSEADLILSEYQEKMKDALLDAVKQDIENIKSENQRLKEENKKLKDKENVVNSKERELKYKEDNLKREVEKEFYDKNIGENLERYIENCELWFADKYSYQKEKCNLCNKDRKLIAEFPNGKQTETVCDCARYFTKYQPSMTEEQVIKFYKRNSNYSSERRYYLTKIYVPNKNSNCYNNESYTEFKIGHIVDEFNEGTKEIYKNLRYDEKLGFRSKEECQKYCDWLNEKENSNNEFSQKIISK